MYRHQNCTLIHTVFMTDSVIVYYGCQFDSSATTYSVLIILEESSTNSHLTVLYNILLYCDTKAAVYRYMYRYTSSLQLIKAFFILILFVTRFTL